MNADYQKVKEDLSALGLCKGDAVLVHSSFKSMVPWKGAFKPLWRHCCPSLAIAEL